MTKLTREECLYLKGLVVKHRRELRKLFDGCYVVHVQMTQQFLSELFDKLNNINDFETIEEGE